MKLSDLLEEAKARGVQLRVEGDKLKVLAPSGALTPELRAALGERKSEILSLLLGATDGAASQRPPTREIGPIPASSGQKRLWLLEQVSPGTARYHLHFGLRIHGALDRRALERCLREVVARHEVLRTSLRTSGDDLVQVVAEPEDVGLPFCDLRSLPVRQVEEALLRRSIEQARTPFDLHRGPLFRASLTALGADDHVLLVTQHHAIADAWSLIQFVRELVTLYDAFSRGAPSPLPPPLQYADAAIRQRGWLATPESERQRAHWRRRLEGLPSLDLSASKRAAVRTAGGATVPVHLSEDLSRRLEALARREGTTLFTVLASGFAVLLSRYTGQTDFGIGTVMANRGDHALAAVLGFFANTVVIRCDLGSSPSALTLLRRMHATVLDAQDHQELPFDEVVRATSTARGQGLNPLVQACIVLESFSLPEGAASSPRWSALQDSPDAAVPGTAKFDLGLTIAERPGGLWGALEYSTDLFEGPAMERLVGHLQCVLEGVVEDPSRPVSRLPLLTEAERRLLLVAWNTTDAELPASCFPERFAAQAARTPDAAAVIFEERVLTYGQLDEATTRLAALLRSLGVGPGVPVGVFLDRSIELMVAVVGVLAAGGAYVPLDPSYPDARIAFLLRDSGVPIVLTRRALGARLPETSARVVTLDDGALPCVDSVERRPPGVRAGDLAYILYTSGSTGTPKGAANTHEGLTNRLRWMQKAFALTAEDRVLQKTPIGFDVSVWELLWPLEVGAALVLARPEGHKDPLYLTSLIEAASITTVHFVPSMLGAFLPALDPGRCTSLRRVICSGEELPRESVDRFLSCSAAELHNLYGPTEASIDVTAYRCSPGGAGPVPIGRPIDNTALHVLDAELAPVPIGVAGELYIAGVGLARGYWRRPDLTAERFVPNPFVAGARMYRTGDRCRYREDGTLEFLGRLDHQIKIRGHRIELGEIEANLSRHPAVAACVVAAREDPPADRRLVAYVVPRGASAPDAASLREHLRAALPEAMVPSAFVWLAELPLTASGKVDRRALPAPERQSPSEGYVDPSTPTEERLAAILAQVLRVDRVGRHDDFFALGGHSLLAARVVSPVRQAFDVELPLRAIFERPTLAEMAATVDALRAGAPCAPEAPPDLEADAALAPSISFAPAPGATPRGGVPGAVLLTGATGFLGAFLLAELLRSTQAVVHCLVRARGEEECAKRIRSNLEAYALWQDAHAPRIVGVPGELGPPLLGLAPERFDRLANEVDRVYHNGALVNFLHPYRALKAPNVAGTQEILRLAMRGRPKELHYVSTASVLPLDRSDPIAEDEPLGPPGSVEGGYAQSKWVAEQLVREASRRGLPVAIYRPGRVTGHSETGAWNTGDLLCRVIQACVEVGAAPEMDALLDLTPVDYVSRAIVALSRDARSIGATYHLVNDDLATPGRLWSYLRSLGYQIKGRRYRAWIGALSAHASTAPDGPIAELVAILQQFPIEEGTGEPPVARAGTERARRDLDAHDIVCPPVDGRLLARYVATLVDRGLLPLPAER